MTTQEKRHITSIAILVEIDGNCHQVLASKEHKELMLTFLSGLTDGIKVSEELMPVEFKTK